MPCFARNVQWWISVALPFLALRHIGLAQQSCPANKTVSASVVAFDQVVAINRLGSVRPEGMIYALLRDVVPSTGSTLRPGNVQLRPGKRPRPLVLRVHEGECLQINFQNFLNPQPLPTTGSLQPATRNASIHVAGMQLVNGIADDGTYVGANPQSGGNFSGVVPPGGQKTYLLYAVARGAYLMYSTPAGIPTSQLACGSPLALV